MLDMFILLSHPMSKQEPNMYALSFTCRQDCFNTFIISKFNVSINTFRARAHICFQVVILLCLIWYLLASLFLQLFVWQITVWSTEAWLGHRVLNVSHNGYCGVSFINSVILKYSMLWLCFEMAVIILYLWIILIYCYFYLIFVMEYKRGKDIYL